MIRYYYKRESKKKLIRIFSLFVFVIGITIAAYVFFPVISWQIYFQPVFASQNIAYPIPRNTIISSSTLQTLVSHAHNKLSGTDYTNAETWFPNLSSISYSKKRQKPKISSYTISVPKINLKHITVSTIDTNLSKYLINYPGTVFPGDLGSSVIFGHSTLPQLFNPKDYKTIFANLYKIKVGDKIHSFVNGVSYTHKVYGITVVDPSDTSALIQNYDSSYLTLVTCTPPGTVWKRLIIKAKLEELGKI